MKVLTLVAVVLAAVTLTAIIRQPQAPVPAPVRAVPDCPYGDQPGTPIRRPNRVTPVPRPPYQPDVVCWPMPAGA